MVETYKFVEDEDELRWFWTYGIPPLKKNELYFASLSARNKRLTLEERTQYKLGRSEMFAKTIIRHDDFNNFVKHLRRFECDKRGFLTKAGVPYPDKVLVLYFNICPINAYTSLQDLIKESLASQKQLLDAALTGKDDAINESWHKLTKMWDSTQSIFARNFGTREWLDLDLDIDNYKTAKGWSAIDKIKSWMTGFLGVGNVMLVQTTGGIHCLIRRSSLAELSKSVKADPMKRILTMITPNLELGGINVKEVVRNDNEQIPLPGTLQYGSLVTVLNKDDFSEEHMLHPLPR
jgi:hypothetical protein